MTCQRGLFRRRFPIQANVWFLGSARDMKSPQSRTADKIRHSFLFILPNYGNVMSVTTPVSILASEMKLDFFPDSVLF
jgi:hypothetical protein